MRAAPNGIASMGVDVAIGRGLDIVGLDESLGVLLGPVTVPLADLSDVIRQSKPDVIAVDSPPAWGASGKSRPIERQLQALGISIFPTPVVESVRDLHRWMQTGFKVFNIAADLGYPLYRGGAPSAGSAIEVFPHASGVVLRGSLPSAGLAKRVWRRSVLEGIGVVCSEMRTTDHLDAALAAVTGLRFLAGDFSVVGESGDAVLVLPIGRLPTTRYARDHGVASSAKVALGKPEKPRSDLNGQTCGCGCSAPVRRRYLPGHDAKHRSKLLVEANAGNVAASDELRRLGWTPIQLSELAPAPSLTEPH